MAALMAACGGSAEPPATRDVNLGFSAAVVRTGTLLTCTSDIATPVQVTRTSGAQEQTFEMGCPSTRMLTGDYLPSRWGATVPSAPDVRDTAASVQAASSLPPPTVLREGDHFIAIPSMRIEAFIGRQVLEGLGNGIAQPLLRTQALRVATTYGGTGPIRWRYSLTQDGATYYSPSIATREVSTSDLGFWGPMAFAEDEASGTVAMFASNAFPSNIGGQFRNGREFRDVRFVDLDNDGLQDIVSNVYGQGCTLIAMRRPDGTYEIRTPLRADGSCIGGHGETLLVADFDSDGLVDIFLPAYERFDLLKNLGHGEFREVAAESGISFPAYVPTVEGAAVVDIDMNGSVDIVVASEVLLNDGHGHFTPMSQPFGPARVGDEGMSVADLDGDGVFDIVKGHPDLGPRVYWGTGSGTFLDSGWMFDGAVVSAAANGIAIGNFTGGELPDILLGGGLALATPSDAIAGTPGEGPRLCPQIRKRSFTCLSHFLPTAGVSGVSDLLMISDADGDGVEDLVFRQGTLRHARAAQVVPQWTYRFDLRDTAGHRTLYGQALRARCNVDNSILSTKFIDGGNGYMAQGRYATFFSSAWCNGITLETWDRVGLIALGKFAPGDYVTRMPEAR